MSTSDSFWTPEQQKKFEKYCKSKKGKAQIKKSLEEAFNEPSKIPHCHTYPSSEPCCIEWWNNIKDKPFTI